MKKTLALILGIFLAVNVFAQDSQCGDYLYWSFNSTTGELIISGTGDMDNYNISAPWYSHRNNITSISLPDGITHIGDYAFRNCIGLTTIIIPNSVTSIGERAFSGCRGLTSVTIPNSVTLIGNQAFDGCSSVHTVIFEDGNAVLDFSPSAFSDCPIETLYVGRDVLSSLAIRNSGTIRTALMQVTIGNYVTAIPDDAFYRCTGLTSITIPNGVTSIGNSAFRDCVGLTEIIIPEGVTGIGDDAFRGCSGLTSVTLPNSITSIGRGSFRDCSNLTSITIPELVISIGSYTFGGCIGLTEITIPENVISIDRNAFNGCTGLTDVFNFGSTPQNIDRSVFSGLILSDVILHVPACLGDLYRSAHVWQDFNIEEGICLSNNINDTVSTEMPNAIGYYSILGIKLDKEPQSGVYIIMYDNGTTEKRMR